MIREIAKCGVEIVNKIPFATTAMRRVIPGRIWRYISGNDIVNCNKPTTPDLRDEGVSPPGIGTTSKRCHSYKPLDSSQNGEVGHVGNIDYGETTTCCSQNCIFYRARRGQ